MSLKTETELADELQLDVKKVAELRRRHDWPHVRFGRFDIRYTEEQVRQVVEAHSHRVTRTAASPSSPVVGQSAKSAARRRR